MSRILRAFSDWLLTAGLLCALGWSGCQNLDAPWASSGDLPPQWEPKVKETQTDP